jgi:hypothetical protein
MSFNGLTSSLSGSLTIGSASNSYLTIGSSTGSLIIGSSTGINNTYVGGYWSSTNTLVDEINSLKELVQLLFLINGIEIEVDDFIKMSMEERVSYIRDLKIGKILE